ncbi:MAG: methyltransferase domain-containing protein [Myxococcales bacterium]|nr:methyltransferase domain-containing protein [Myxococcales bacterium]
MTVFQNDGFCPICEHDVTFIAYNEWLRDHYVCQSCGSVPRERAVMAVIDAYFPMWRELRIHESSPAKGGASRRLALECADYVPSQFFPGRVRGAMVDGVLCQDLEQLTFADESIDLHVTQDVMEHVFHPDQVFKEIARTLKFGGAHIFTVPIVNKLAPSERRARIDPAGNIVHLKPEQYHGNPISDRGSLVTVDWGFDICQHIFDASGLFTQILHIDDLGRGIRAEYIEVLITFKPSGFTALD